MEDDEPARFFLPADVVAIILRHLPPRALAVSRSVCKSWRAVVDEGGKLRSDLLPLTLGGIFISLMYQPAPPLLFSPPTMGPGRIAGKLESFVKMEASWDIPTILGSSNGLLFLEDQVVNPATRQWAPVPPCPIDRDVYSQGDVYFAFDPTLSPHYEVLFIQRLQDGLEEGSEWPPSTCAMWIYSSGTGRWEDKMFVREGGPAGTVAKERAAPTSEYRHDAVYWHGALYLHCNNDFIMRITISDCKYQVIKLPPVGVSASVYYYLHLVKSKHGVYFAVVGNRCQLRVWFLNELSGNRAEWVLKYDLDLQGVAAHFSSDRDYPVDKPWVLHYDKYNKYSSRRAVADQGNHEWDSDNDNVIEVEPDTKECDYGRYMCLFGFHPYKEMVFLYIPNISRRVVACHLDTLKVQDLGPLKSPYRDDVIDTTYVYAPCWMGDLSERD